MLDEPWFLGIDLGTGSSKTTVVDERGHVLLAGAVSVGPEPDFLIDLAGRLPAGRFTLLAQVIVNSNAMNADIERISFSVVQP